MKVSDLCGMDAVVADAGQRLISKADLAKLDAEISDIQRRVRVALGMEAETCEAELTDEARETLACPGCACCADPLPGWYVPASADPNVRKQL
jgi:hypothetical protein